MAYYILWIFNVECPLFFSKKLKCNEIWRWIDESKKGQTYNAKLKNKIVLEVLKEELTVAQIATRYKVSSQSIIPQEK